MWPDDFIDWAGRFRRVVAEAIERLLNGYLRANTEWTRTAVSALAEQATRYAFDVANDHRRYLEYCRTEAEFRLWVYTVALNEALRLLIRHRFGQGRFLLLSADQRRLLGMRYLDQLPPGDVAGVLHVSADEVREQAKQALEAFIQRFGRPDGETEP
jgi:DNA-directed RNA polymerase specialized sigma24 family protein